MLNEEFVDNNSSGFSEYSETAKYEKNIESKSSRRIIDSESEDVQTNNMDNSFHKIADATSNRFQAIIDSESKEKIEETTDNTVTMNNVNVSETKDNRHQVLIDSEFEEEREGTNNIITLDHINTSKTKNNRLQALIDSESEEEREETTNNIIQDDNASKVKDNKHQSLIDSESEEEREGTNNIITLDHINTSKTKNNRFQALIDSESEEEREETTNNTVTMDNVNASETKDNKHQALIDSESEEEREETVNHFISFDNVSASKIKDIKGKNVPKRKGSKRASQDEAMHQIRSESQRLLRETRISLPYHRPKQRTLQEFLNRQKLSAVLPKAPSVAAKLKMSSAIVSKILAEKEKEAELFYKSSDSEDETQKTIAPANKIVRELSNKNEKSLLTDVNKKESLSLTNNNNRDDGSDVIAQSVTKEDSQKPTVVRKLFDISCEKKAIEVSDVSHDHHKVTQDPIDTIIICSSKETCINDTKEGEIAISEEYPLQISKTHQCDSKVICTNESQHFTTEAMATLEATCTNSKQITKTFQMDNTKNDVATSSNHVARKDNDEKNNCVKADDLSALTSTAISVDETQVEDNLLEKDGRSDGHVLGLPLPKFTDETSSNKKRLLSKLMSNSKVSLKGSPGMIIDLTNDAKPDAKSVNTLLNRFFCKHVVNTSKQDDNKSEVTVVHIKDTETGPVPVKEVLPYKLLVNTDNPELNKPGAKLMRLKEDLRLQMTRKRNEEWKQKEIELQSQEKEEWDEEKEFDCDSDEQNNVFDESSDSGESEPEENDICIKDKKRRKCLFADDEAEVTDDENSDGTCDESDTNEIEYSKKRSKKEHNNANEIEEEEEEEEEEDKEEENENLNMRMKDKNEIDLKNKNDDDVCEDMSIVENGKKKMKRLIVNHGDDSEDDNSQLENISAFRPYREDNDWSGDENNTLQQHTAARSQICKTPVTRTSILDLISPVTQLSVLNTTLDSDKKDTTARREYLTDNHEITFMESIQIDRSPECANRNKMSMQKKLFDNIVESNDDEYLMQLCSGKFQTVPKDNSDLKGSSIECSSSFNLELVDAKQAESSKLEHETSQNIRLSLDEDTLDDFRKGEKEVNTADSRLESKVVSSDDEDQSDGADTFLQPKKRPVKRLNLSDSDEDSVVEDTQLSDDENDDWSDEEEEEQYVDYDSEENEVIVVPKKDLKNVAANFLEKEAELSENDWDSADEDEKDMDKYDFEEADEEHINEDEIKNQLGKIHMKQMLDEDKREVRILKEILFEDGDLHTDGAGRERKFRWRNIDKLAEDASQVHDENDGWVDVQEDEEEAKWVKLRQERDKFLEERMKNMSNEIEDDLRNSKIFKFGLEALKKEKNDEPEKQDTSPNKVESFESMEPIMPRNIMHLLNVPSIEKKSQTIYNVIKRRSLLTRGEEALARIASLAKQSESASHKVNSKNFVFQFVDPHIEKNASKNETDEKSKEKSWNFQTKSRKRKVTSDFKSATKRRRN